MSDEMSDGNFVELTDMVEQVYLCCTEIYERGPKIYKENDSEQRAFDVAQSIT